MAAEQFLWIIQRVSGIISWGNLRRKFDLLLSHKQNSTEPTKRNMGGIYSTTNDLSALDRSILSYTLLSPNTTRGWMKPTPHLIPYRICWSSLGNLCLVLPQPDDRVTDIYAKSGSLEIGRAHV